MCFSRFLADLEFEGPSRDGIVRFGALLDARGNIGLKPKLENPYCIGYK